MEISHQLGARTRIDPPRAAAVVGGAAVLVLLFLAIGVLLGRHPLPLPIVLGFGLGLLGTLALALARYDAAVALGVVLLAAVRIEPAPSDLVFGVLIAVAFATWRFDLQRVPLSVALLVSAFLALNLLASIEVIDSARALNFFAITLYLALFGLWLAAYVNSVRRARLVLVAYLAGAVISAGLACLALMASFPGSEAFVSGPRAQGLFKDPNVFGPFLVPAALVLMEELVAPRLLRLRFLPKLALLSILTMGVLFSFSRAAWLNLVVGALVLLSVLALRRGGGRQAMALLVCTIAACAATFRGGRGDLFAFLPRAACRAPGLRHPAVRRAALRPSVRDRVPARRRARASSNGSPTSRRTAPTFARSPRRECSGCWSCSGSCC